MFVNHTGFPREENSKFSSKWKTKEHEKRMVWQVNFAIEMWMQQ